MKGSKRYFVILGVFMVLAFVFQYYSPKPFRWTPTFYHNDRQPFGCYVFDEVVGTSVVAYEVQNRSLLRNLYGKCRYVQAVARTERFPNGG